MMLKNHTHRAPVQIESMEPRWMFDASQLTESIVASTLPVSLSDLNALKGKVTLSISNNSGVKQSNPVHVVVVGTTDPAFDPYSQNDKQLGFQNTRLTLTNGQSKTFRINVNTKKGFLSDGAYTVYAFLLQADSSNAFSFSQAGPTVTIRQPIINLAETESFAKLPASVLSGGKFNITDKIAITNTGSDPSTDPLSINVIATPDGIPADGTSIKAEVKKITIRPGKTAIVQFRLPTFPTVALGTYSLITQVTTTNGTASITDPSTAPTIAVE